MRTHTTPFAGVAVAAALLMTGCGAAPATDTAAVTEAPEITGDLSAADSMFLAMMIPHHEQAMDMAEIVLAADGVDDRVRAIAERIKAAQGPEIATMRGWLDASGVDAGAMDHGAHGGMDGMLTEAQMDALRAASGAEATRLFLEGMIQHHEGAILMAQGVLVNGRNAEVRALAEDIVRAQQAEIDEMRDLLAAMDGGGSAP